MRQVIGIWLAMVGCADVELERPRHTGEFLEIVSAPPKPRAESQRPANVLFVLVDDVGIDKVRSYYPEIEGLARQPTLDRLASEGMRFENAYAQSVCSPTRAALLTGRHARRLGIGRWIPASSGFELPLEAVTVPEVLAEAAPDHWSTAAFGKWHLGSSSGPSGKDHPNLQGFDHYSGVMDNFGTAEDFFANTKTVNGEPTPYEAYATTDTMDDATDWIREAPEPWFAYVATQAIHKPLHRPPDALHSFVEDAVLSPEEELIAMLEALDTELGRLLDTMDPEVRARTNIVVMGDNGSAAKYVAPPFLAERVKGSVYEGGVRVPLIVVGPAVGAPGTVSEALVHVTDWLPTIAEWADVDRATVEATLGAPADGHSLVHVLKAPDVPSESRYLYADRFRPLGPPPYSQDLRTVRDERWKIIDHYVDGVSFYDLSGFDVDEGDPLPLDDLNLEEQEAFDRLQAELDRMGEELVYGL